MVMLSTAACPAILLLLPRVGFIKHLGLWNIPSHNLAPDGFSNLVVDNSVMSKHPRHVGFPLNMFEVTVWLGALQDRLAGDIAELLGQVGLEVSFSQVTIEFAVIPRLEDRIAVATEDDEGAPHVKGRGQDVRICWPRESSKP